MRTAATHPRSPTRAWIWLAVAGIVAVAAAVAVVAARGGSGDTPGSTAAGVAEHRPVTIDGDPLPPLEDPGADPAVGRTIPTVRGASFDGTPVVIAPGGRARVIVFLAHWCPHCQAEVPRLVSHLATRRLPATVELVGVATASSPDRPNWPPSAWLDREGWPARVLADDTGSPAAEAFGVTGFPFFVAVAADGTVIARAAGELTTAQFDSLVAAAAAR